MNSSRKPNILFVMTDQQRFDTIAALGNDDIYTPHFDRLVRRGVAFTNAYSPCPVCLPARYIIRTGRDPLTTGYFQNESARLAPGQPPEMAERCGPFLAHTMKALGYRTFGVGKFHPMPPDDSLGYETYLQAEEYDGWPDDAYEKFIAEEHPEYAHIEQLHGERTNMYYMPQTSALPEALTDAAWKADRAIENVARQGDKPFFGFVSFIGPHPPFAPPVPFNRMYDPDRMPDPVLGDPKLDLMDARVPWNNYFVYAEDLSNARSRALKARYYGDISHIDQCIGRILDAVEERDDADNTLICFFSDHGEFLGDHRTVQKESFFEASCHVPFLLSWPSALKQGLRRDDLLSLTDLFGIATTAAGQSELRDGIDVLGVLDGTAEGREHLLGFSSAPGDLSFRIMVRKGPWKYVYMANGGHEQLFNLDEDSDEKVQRLEDCPDIVRDLKRVAIEALDNPSGRRALDGDDFRRFPATKLKLERCKQFNAIRGVTDFPAQPGHCVTMLS